MATPGLAALALSAAATAAAYTPEKWFKLKPLGTPPFPTSWGAPPAALSTDYSTIVGAQCGQHPFLGDQRATREVERYCRPGQRGGGGPPAGGGTTERECWDRCQVYNSVGASLDGTAPSAACVAATFFNSTGCCRLFSACGASEMSYPNNPAIRTLISKATSGRYSVMGGVDYVPLAGGYGFGSAALSKWILDNIQRDADAGKPQYPPVFGDLPPVEELAEAFDDLDDQTDLPFGYGKGSALVAKWLKNKAAHLYDESAHAFQRYQETHRAPGPFPAEWGALPADGPTDDWVPLAGGFGHGSSTVSAWILENMARDHALGRTLYPPLFGKPPQKGRYPKEDKEWVQLPFGYGHGSGTMRRWLCDQAFIVYKESSFYIQSPRLTTTTTTVDPLSYAQYVEAAAHADSWHNYAGWMHQYLQHIVVDDRQQTHAGSGARSAPAQVIV